MALGVMSPQGDTVVPEAERPTGHRDRDRTRSVPPASTGDADHPQKTRPQ